jgi:hypothetical protein
MRVNGVDFNPAFAKGIGEDDYANKMLCSPFFLNKGDRKGEFKKVWRLLNGKPVDEPKPDEPKPRKAKEKEEGAE